MNNQKHTFQDWLEEKYNVKIHSQNEEALKLFSIPENESESNISGQNSIGIGDNSKSESKTGQELDIAIQNNDSGTVISLLTGSPGNAVSSILGLAQSRSNWNPLDPDSKENQNGFQAFVKQLLLVPIFNTTQSSTTNVKYSEENYNSLIDKVVNLYDGITEKDITAVKSSIVNLAKACTSRVNTKNTKTLFVQNTLNSTKGNNIVVGIQQTFMMMERSQKTGKGAPKDKYKTEITVNTLELTFQSNLWTEELAKGLAGLFVKSWDNWLNGTSTPASPSQSSIKFCF